MRKGITLIEIVISIALVGIILVSMLSIFDTGLFNIKRAGDRTSIVVGVSSQVDNLLSGGQELVDESNYLLESDVIEEAVQVVFKGTSISYTFAESEYVQYTIKNIDDLGKNIWVDMVVVDKNTE
jgi:type II secretory pathway pseudopilin PulG